MRSPYTLSAFQQSVVDDQIKQTLLEMDLAMSKISRSTTDTKVLKRPCDYVKHYTGLRYLFAMIGDWQSSLSLLPNPPDEFCPAMNVASLVLFVDWKSLARGTLMTTESSGVSKTMKTFFGDDLVSVGAWHNPGNITQFASAITAAHLSIGHGQETYKEPCDQCISV